MIVIDLHQTRHADARNIVIRTIEDYWNTGETIRFITGKSKNMQSIVIDVAEEYNLKTYGSDIYDLGFIIIYL